MRNSLALIIMLSVAYSAFSCKQEPVEPMPPKPVDTLCVENETITDFTTMINVYFPGDTTNGVAKAVKTNKSWKAKAFAGAIFDKRFIQLSISSRFCEDLQLPFCNKESMLFWLPKKRGCFDLINANPPTIDSTTIRVDYKTYDGDVEEDAYKLEPDSLGNTLEITHLDTIAKIVEGKFAASFRLVTRGGKINPENPDKVRFFNGEFWAKIQ